jgi:plasmid stability protein
MATITVRDLPDDVQRRLKQRAAANDRSMEGEARAILSAAVAAQGFGTAWLELAARYRGEEELPLPERSQPRDIDLS